MSVEIVTEAIPLNTDAHGVVRVGGTRVTLDTVIAAFRDGATAEAIVDQYPVLNLGDVYTTIGYYLRHQADVDSYLEKRQQEAVQIRAENEARFAPVGIRSRLMTRRPTEG